MNNEITHVTRSKPVVTKSIYASTDEDAVKTWLAVTTNGSPNTLQSYRKEVSRLMSWCKVNNLQIPDIKLEHLIEFVKFLQNPPLSMIGSPKHIGHIDWKPFSKPLSPRSAYYSVTVVGGMLGFLEDAGYIQSNPMRLFVRISRNSASKASRINARRKPIPVDAQEVLSRCLLECVGEFDVVRGRWLVNLFFHSGLRLSEVASIRMKDFFKEKEAWYLKVKGKGSKERIVVIPSIIIRELAIYRHFLGLSDTPSLSEEMFVVGNQYHPNTGITARGLSLAIHRFLLYLEIKFNLEPGLFIKIHPHLFRHTAATKWLNNGATLADVREQLGHGSIATTSLYVTPENSQRHKSIENAS